MNKGFQRRFAQGEVDKGMKIYRFSIFLLILLLAFTLQYNLFYTVTALAVGPQKSIPTTLQEVQNTPIDDLVKLSTYDGRKLGTVTEVGDQGGTGVCWAYATMSSVQSNLLRKGVVKSKEDFPWMLEDNIAYTMYNRVKGDPLENTNETTFTTDRDKYLFSGGFPQETPSLFSQGRGISPYSSQSDNFDNCYDFMNAIYVENSVEAIKRAVAQYGGVAFTYRAQMADETYVFNKDKAFNHACEIVGWDDTIDKNKFESKYLLDKTKPTKDGAWICKNSWGLTYLNKGTNKKEPVGDNGYFYLSYESLMTDIVAFDFALPTEYDNIYFYDAKTSKMTDQWRFTAGISGDKKVKAANIYEAKASTISAKEMLKAVNVGIYGDDVRCTVRVYTGLDTLTSNPESGILKGSVTQSFQTTGFYTINLNELIELKNGELFSIVVEVTNEQNTATILCDADYASTHDYSQCWDEKQNTWRNAKNINQYTARIKGFTINQTRDTMVQNDISFATIHNLPTTVLYNEKEHEPNFTLQMGDVNLILNQDYTTTYLNNILPGTATVTIQGIGQYTGSIQRKFTINKAPAPENIPGEKESNSNQRRLEVESYVQKFADISLPIGWRWVFPDNEVVTGENKINHVQYYDEIGYERTMFDVIVTKKSGNTSSDTTTPTEIDIVNCTVQILDVYTYTGQQIEPKIEVYYQNNKLVENVDYYCNYENNINATDGARILVYGKGKYKGVKICLFSIQQAERPNIASINIEIPKDAKYLKDIPLPKDWCWKEPDKLLSAFTTTRNVVMATIVYIGADKANYTNTEREIQLNLKTNTVVVPSYQQPNAPIQESTNKRSTLFRNSMIIISIVIVLIALTIVLVVVFKRKKSKKY